MEYFARALSVLREAQGVFALSSLLRDDDDDQDGCEDHGGEDHGGEDHGGEDHEDDDHEGT